MNAKRSKTTTPRTPPRSRREKPLAGHEGPAGVQGANIDYWQAVGSTRSAAKRSKRP